MTTPIRANDRDLRALAAIVSENRTNRRCANESGEISGFCGRWRARAGRAPRSAEPGTERAPGAALI